MAALQLRYRLLLKPADNGRKPLQYGNEKGTTGHSDCLFVSYKLFILPGNISVQYLAISKTMF